MELNVYAVKATVGDLVKLEEVFKGAMIFLVMDYVALAVSIPAQYNGQMTRTFMEGGTQTP